VEAHSADADRRQPAPAAVAFQFTPLLGDWQIDDVYVDPRRFM
jgi:hypothetical protein